MALISLTGLGLLQQFLEVGGVLRAWLRAACRGVAQAPLIAFQDVAATRGTNGIARTEENNTSSDVSHLTYTACSLIY